MASDITKIVVVHPALDADDPEDESEMQVVEYDAAELQVNEHGEASDDGPGELQVNDHLEVQVNEDEELDGSGSGEFRLNEHGELQVSGDEDVDSGADQTIDASQDTDRTADMSQNSDTDSKRIFKPFRTKSKNSKYYDQMYRRVWETMDEFKGWLQSYPSNRFLSWCLVCQRSLRARKKDLLVHARTQKHQQNAALMAAGEPIIPTPTTPKTKMVFQKSLLYRAELAGWLCEIPNNPSRGWCKYCASRLTPQLVFLQNHSRSAKHLRNESQRAPQPPPQTDIDGDRDEPKQDLEMIARMEALRNKRDRDDPDDDDEDWTPEETRERKSKRARRLPARYRSRSSSPLAPGNFSSAGGDVGDGGSARHIKQERRQPGDANNRSGSPLLESDFASRVTYSIGIGNRKVGFIGAGQITQAIAQGMLEQGLLLPTDVMVSATSQRNLPQWRRWKCQTTTDNDEVMREADIIFVAVKLGSLAGMISKLTPVSDGRSRLVISVVPGVSRERLLELLQQRVLPPEGQQEAEEAPSSGLHVVRAAPNKMMSVSQGFCAYCIGEDLPHALYLVVEIMFSAVGSCVQVEESLMDVYSVMVSSGAAFTCAFIESLIQAGVNQSMPWDDALKAAATVVCGTSQLLLRSGAEPSALKKAIATPGGATIAALTALHSGGLDDAVVTALEVACEKTADAGGKV